MSSLIKELPILLYDYLVISGLVTTINDSLSLALSGSIAYKITILAKVIILPIIQLRCFLP